MIRLLYGENSFLIERAVAEIKKTAKSAEIFDGSELTTGQLADAFGGMSLFALNRTVIIKNLNENTQLWPDASNFLDRVSDTDVVLVESNLDKRTKTYKWLKKHANTQEYLELPSNDSKQIAQWVEQEASAMDLKLTSHQARRIYERVGGNQWRLFHALEKLAVLPEVSDEVIDAVIEPHPNENVFVLLETCLNKDITGVQRMIGTLRQTDDPYRIFGLLSGQVFQLTALVYSDGSVGRVSTDLGVSSYVLGNLAPYANRLSKDETKALIEDFAHTDDRMKRSDTDVWTLIENLLSTIASR